jgi:deoxyribodipyrimidine photo-lyase
MTPGLFDSEPFEPTPAAARARLAAVRPGEYARTRNHLDGAVSRLSPYITHGLLTLPEVLDGVLQRHPGLPVQHKWVYELGWREYFHHVWHHEGDGILQSLHEGPLPGRAYARELPADLREARTGVPVADQAVRELYTTGWLHNHARMWLASYAVHIRKVHWRAGADWMFGHLLDGDLASNHLSWQWVAGTGSHKPYLFNAENVARYAPPAWHSPGTVVDQGYDALERIAFSARAPVDRGRGGPEPEGIAEPVVSALPPAGFEAPDATVVAGRPVWLMHPWALAEAPATLPPGTLKIGVLVAEWHAAWPWSAARWRFVARRLQQACDRVWCASGAALNAALAPASSVQGIDNPHLGTWPGRRWLAPMPRLFDDPPRRCGSFSQFWTQVTRRRTDAAELLKT